MHHLLIFAGIASMQDKPIPGTACRGGGRAPRAAQLERLCRYDVQGSTSVARGRKPGATTTRPAIAGPRLSLAPSGNVRYRLKTSYRDGTTHVIFEPLDLMYRKYGMPRAQGCAGAAWRAWRRWHRGLAPRF